MSIYIPLCLYLYESAIFTIRFPNLFTFHYVYIYIIMIAEKNAGVGIFTFHYVYIYIRP